MCRILSAVLVVVLVPWDTSPCWGQTTPLFDGKTFAGWEGDTKNTWRIEEGSIVGGSLEKMVPRNEFLCTTKSYADFELKVKFKLLGERAKANAGVQFRTKRIPNHHEVSGYQADIGQHYWGALYDESRRNKILAQPDKAILDKLIKHEDWNEYTIRCEGPRSRLWLNGTLTVDYTEKDDRIERTGIVGLQIHGGAKAKVFYKDIRIEELNPAKLYVTNSMGDSIHVIDLRTFKVTGQIKTGDRPHGAAAAADGRHFFSSVEGDHTLLVIDASTDRIVKTIKLSGLPNECAVTPDGKYVGVPIRGGDSVDLVDVAQGRVVKNLPVKVPHNCYNARRNDHLWVTSMGAHKVHLIDLKTLAYVAEIPVGGVPRPLAVTRDEKTLYCALSDLHGFVIADIGQRKVVQTVELPALPPGVKFPVPNTPTHGLELSPDEKELWVTSCATDTVYVINTSTRKIVGKVGVGRGPNWVTFSPDGTFCCVSNVLSDDVSILDVAQRKEVARVKVGKQPKRLVVTP